MEVSFNRNPGILSSSTFTENRNYSTGIQASNKTKVFDINAIGNRLSQQQVLMAPSSRSFQIKEQIKLKNTQSDMVKSVFTPPQESKPSFGVKKETKIEPKPLQLFSSEKSQLQIPSAAQQKGNNNQMTLSSKQLMSQQYSSYQQEQTIQQRSQRSQMYDFRKTSSRSIDQKPLPYYQLQSNRNIFSSQKQENTATLQNRYLQKPLTPIKETKDSQVIPPSRSIMDPDNQILFLDNGSRIVNPINAKTPPPPMWGEVLEEENYDPNEEFYDDQKAKEEMRQRIELQQKAKQEGKKLRKKVLYVIESDSESDNEQQNGNIKSTGYSVMPPQSNSRSMIEVPRLTVSNAIRNMSETRQQQSSKHYQSNSNALRYDNSYGQQQVRQDSLPQIRKQIDKPPIPQQYRIGSSSQQIQLMPASRQIRTGGFQKLPIIAALHSNKQ